MNYVQNPPSGLIVAIQYFHDDELAALRLARLLADVESARRDDVTLAFCRRFDCPVSGVFWQTFLHCGQKFRVMQLQSRREGVGHPLGANELWSGVMQQLASSWKSGNLSAASVFAIEADGVPLRRDWIDLLQAEHARALDSGKRVTGALVERPFKHVNGSLMSHVSMWLDRMSLWETPPQQAWDLFHAAVLMQEARPTSLIKNIYDGRDWTPAALTALARETAWMASVKDESAISWAERALVDRPGTLGSEEATPVLPGGRRFVHG